MKSFIRYACIIGLVIAAELSITGCAKQPPAAQSVSSPSPEALRKMKMKETLVAKVNGVGLSLDALENMMARISTISHETSTAGPPEEIRKRALNQLVVQELAIQEAKRLGLSVKQRDIDAAISALVGHELKDYDALLARLNVTDAEFRSELERSMLIRLVITREVIEKADVSEDEARKEYETRKEEYIVPEKVSVLDVTPASQSADQSSAKKAKKLIAQIKSAKGKNLQELASNASFTVHDRDLEKNKEHALYDAARKLKQGKLSGVIKAGDAVHIIQLTAYTPERQIPYEEVKGALKGRLRAQALKKRREAWEQELRKGAQIEFITPEQQPEQKKSETTQ